METPDTVAERDVVVLTDPPASVGGFLCPKEPEIQTYFANGGAERDAARHVARSHYLVAGESLLGCFALQADSVQLHNDPKRPSDLIAAPAVKLARFGRNDACPIRKIRLDDGIEIRVGKYLLDLVFARALQMHEFIAVRYITLDARPDPTLVKWYEEQGFRKTNALVKDPDTGAAWEEINMLYDLHDAD